ncbi:hypothetical protein SHO565_32340 [Streptomyces sp. HO565]
MQHEQDPAHSACRSAPEASLHPLPRGLGQQRLDEQGVPHGAVVVPAWFAGGSTTLPAATCSAKPTH